MSDDPYEGLSDEERKVVEFLKALTMEALKLHQEAIDKGLLPGLGKKGVVFMVGEMQNPDPGSALRVAIACGTCHALDIRGYAPNEQSVHDLIVGLDGSWSAVKAFQGKHEGCPAIYGADYSALVHRVQEEILQGRAIPQEFLVDKTTEGTVVARPANQIPIQNIPIRTHRGFTRDIWEALPQKTKMLLAQRTHSLSDLSGATSGELFATVVKDLSPITIQAILRGERDDA